MSREVYLTREGYEKLRKELDYLKRVRRREITQQIAEARAHGDISENAEYDAAKEAQGLVEKKIHQLESKLSRVRILEEEQIPNDKVYIGSVVHLRDLNRERELCYTLVSEEETDYAQGKISTTAPVGRGLLGHKEGEIVTIKVPSGTLRYQILKISR
jgi:transcription elongation factor GreA